MPKVATSAAFLLLAVVYLALGFDYELSTSGGRLGAGFFPRVIGVALVLAAAYNFVSDLRHRQDRNRDAHWLDALVVAVAVVLFIVLLGFIGAVPAMVLFMFAVLAILNRGRWVTNVVLSLALPIALYLLFSVWLGTRLPEGRFEGLPFS